MGFYGDGDSKAFANIENIYGNGKVTKYECHMGFYGDGDSKAFANIENIYGNGKVTKYECIWGFMVTVIARPLLTLKTYMEMGM